ncbi:hypothetical protein AC1031_005362 [Aphanomyces cochlioides]|nr:hypothetical protein AC1031_005362 [Aphanomyces cochlioides]
MRGPDGRTRLESIRLRTPCASTSHHEYVVPESVESAKQWPVQSPVRALKSALKLTKCRVEMVDCFPHLKVLNVAQNQLTHLPPDIGGLQKLKKLFAQNNQLRSLPMSLMSCSKLEELFVQFNSIREIPNEFSHLSLLHSLSLAHNEIKSLPNALNSLANLKLVDLTGNPLTDVPEQLRRLHDRHAVLHSRQKRRELITRALKVKNAVKQALKTQARLVAATK